MHCLARRVPISFLPDFLIHSIPLLCAGRRSCPCGCRRVTIPASISIYYYYYYYRLRSIPQNKSVHRSMARQTSTPIRVAISIALVLINFADSQEALSLPPPCPLGGAHLPGDTVPPFVVPLTSGKQAIVPAGVSLPLVAFSVDFQTDPGGVLLATDTIEIDRMLSESPPSAGTLLFVSQSTPGGGDALERIFEARLALQPIARATAWKARLAFAAPTLDMLRASGCALAALLDGWESPRLWVDAPPPNPISAPRVDGFYECFMWPPAQVPFARVFGQWRVSGATSRFCLPAGFLPHGRAVYCV